MLEDHAQHVLKLMRAGGRPRSPLSECHQNLQVAMICRMVNTRSRPLKRATVARARSLRRNSSEAENKLWRILRNRGVEGAKFLR